MKDKQIRVLVLLSMLAAVAYALVCLIRIPVVGFLSYEPKDVIITISGFLLGPMSSFVISLTVSLLAMVTISSTGPIGGLMNLISSCSFACTAAFIYKYRRDTVGGIVGLIAGSCAMVAVMLLWNWLITPLYMGVSREAVEGMLIPMFLPFNALKAGLNSGFTLLLYKPLVTALRKTRLIDSRSTSAGGKKIGLYLFAAGLLITCVLLLLVFQGRI